MPPVDGFLDSLFAGFSDLLSDVVANWFNAAIQLLVEMITEAFTTFLGSFFALPSG